MDSERTRRVTLYWMLAISLVITVLVLLQFMNNEGVWLMPVTDQQRWWQTRLTRSLNLAQIGLVALALLVLLGLSYLYERRTRYAEHAFFLLVAVLQISTMEARQFATTIPQAFWAPVVVAIAFTTLGWSAVVLAVQLAMVLAFWGIQGAFTQPVSLIFLGVVFGALATGRYLRDQEIASARLLHRPGPQQADAGLPSPKRAAPVASPATSAASAATTPLPAARYAQSSPEGRAFLAALNRRSADS